MPSDSLRALARHLSVPERTLRRAAVEGLVHGERISERQFKTTLREETYLRAHWPLLSVLRAALRTEPNVRLAVLFGSFATGRETVASDVDLLTILRDPSAAKVGALSERLSRRVGRDIQIVRLEDAKRSPLLLADALEQGRVLVDRESQWQRLHAQAPRWRRQADRAVPLLDAMPDLDEA
jgi:predicted nucleotidyltransferase